MVSVLRPGQRILNIPAIGVSTSRRAVSSGNGLLNSLIAYWPGNEASGNMLDAHTNGLTLTPNGALGNATGKVYPTARNFAATTLYASRADSALISAGDVDFTLSAWSYLTSIVASSSIAGKEAGGGQREYNLGYDAVSRRFWFAVSTGYGWFYAPASSLGAPAINTWYLVVGWHDSVANTINVQIDNGTVDSVAHAAGVKDGTAAFYIGYSDLLGYSKCYASPVAMWKSAANGGGVLTAAQRTALWNAGAGLPYASFTV